MSKSNKILFAIFGVFVSAITFFNVSALKIGDEIGNVLNTDIKTYINGNRIPSYNINNKAVVLIKDLNNYGFDTIYDNAARTSTVIYNPDKEFTPVKSFEENSKPSGTVAFKYLHTDIVAYVNGKQVESFNIKGNLAIFFEDIGDYGTFAWENTKRESKFEFYKSVSFFIESITYSEGELYNSTGGGGSDKKFTVTIEIPSWWNYSVSETLYENPPVDYSKPHCGFPNLYSFSAEYDLPDSMLPYNTREHVYSEEFAELIILNEKFTSSGREVLSEHYLDGGYVEAYIHIYYVRIDDDYVISIYILSPSMDGEPERKKVIDSITFSPYIFTN